MKPERCPMALLVEAKRDGRLGERELGSVDRHVATCASCVELARDLDTIRALLRTPMAALAPLEVQRGRLKLLREAALPTPPAKAAKRPWTTLGLALAAAGALGLALHERSSGSHAELPPPLAASANVPWRTITTVVRENEARFTHTEEGGVEIVRLTEGAVSLAVRHLQAGERFLVKTGDAEVEVRGTLFRVEAASDHLRTVAVSEGKVEVRFHGASFVVTADQRWDRPADAAPVAPASAPPAEAPSLAASTANLSPIDPPLAASAKPAAPAKLAPAVKLAATAKAASSAEPAASSEEGLGSFEQGMGMMERGDYGAAAKHLEAFSKSNPRDDRSEDAAFLVILALSRAGRSVEATAAARRYLATYPAGYRRAQAQAIVDAP